MAERIFVATRKGLFIFEQSAGADGWKLARESFLGDTVTMVLPDARDGSLYAAIGHGHFGVKLHRSRDGGEQWEEHATPAYPPKPEGLNDGDANMGRPIPWSTQLVWSLEAGGAEEPGVLWCGTIPGGLFRSRDGGDSWEMIDSLWNHPWRKEWFGGGYDYPGIHSICVDGRDARHVTIGVSCGGVWVTEDGGASWNCRTEGMYAAYMPPEQRSNPATQDPHRLVHCRAQPDFLWTQHHNGVFRSTNGGTSWTEVTTVAPSTFGFAAAVHPTRPEVAWLVPAISDQHRVPTSAQLVVARTRDGGETFEALRNGLPQEHAYDLVYRHGLDVSGSGDCLAMGSTTGGLWVSEDQGDSWKALPVRLPPIYAVRFMKS